ncbi:MAG: pyrroline-5-carboxylate reductase [Bacteroidales bacterium]|jgi:pyrroline-5-carboxylate reductase|nr:pyrroline-5-carboxylate reductase [Bacteroidales bacterium]
MKNTKIAVLGGGNLGTSLAKGLVASKQFDKSEITVTDKRESRISHLLGLGFRSSADSLNAVSNADIVIMSVKPQQFADLAEEIRGAITPSHIVLSTVTGVSFRDIESFFGKIPLVRIMPNTALEICESMTCIAFRNTLPEHEERVVTVFNKMGKTAIIQEDLMGAATVIGACGIAFALRFIRAMSQGGIEIGFNSEMSQLITSQTVKGAARLIIETSNHPEMEIDKVTTPQGITISGLNEMEHQGLSSAVIRGLMLSFNKLENLGSKTKK